MPKVSPLQNNFSAGEFSPLLVGRVDADRYKSGLRICQNQIPLLQGPVTRRQGTKYVGGVKTNSKVTRLLPFTYSTTQSYILEFGDQYIRYYKNEGQIQVSSTAYETATAYLEADLFSLRYTQSNDVMYLTHVSYPPRKLLRYGDSDWKITDIDFQDGPYMSTNVRTFTLTPGAATGTTSITAGPSVNVAGTASNGTPNLIRVTATAHGLKDADKVFIASVGGTTEANGTWTINYIDVDNFDLRGSTFTHAWTSGGTIRPAIFASTDVGRLIRLQEGSVWGWVKITAFTDAAHVTVDVKSTLTNTSAKTVWRLGLYSATTGYPRAVFFHEDRLVFIGPSGNSQRIDASNSSDYENFKPTELNGTVTDANALAFALNSNQVNALYWGVSDEKGIILGTKGSEWIVRSGVNGDPLTPLNVSAKEVTSHGSANIQAIRAGKATIFIQGASRKVREMSFYWDIDGFRSPDMTELSEHISIPSIVDMAYQKEPQPIIWMVRSDGTLVSMTYQRESSDLRVGFARHIFGGASDAAGTQALVESVAVIPNPTGTSYETWFVVKRYINGSAVRYIEYLTPFFDQTVKQRDAFFVDCGLTYDTPKTITGITIASPGVITCVAHGFSNGDEIRLYDIHSQPPASGATNGLSDYLNEKVFYVANKATDTFQLTDADGNAINTTGYTTYVSGGVARKLVSTLSGLSHLEGQTVQICGDGGDRADQVVTSGSITLDIPAAVAQVGLGYTSDGSMLRVEGGAADGTALGKTRRINQISILLDRTLGLSIGSDFGKLDIVEFRTSATPGDAAPPLFTGIIRQTFEADYDRENYICWRQNRPLPFTILAVMPQMTTQDMG